jgi:DNA adenine methylase
VTGAAAGGAARIAPVIKWPGSKVRLAPWIVGLLPRHEVYVEPYAGSLAVFFAKEPSRLELVNDLDRRVYNLFRVIRERPEDLMRAIALTPWSRAEADEALAGVDAGDEVERARRLLVWCWQQIGRRMNAPGSGGGWRWTKDAGSTPVPQWLALPERIAAAAARLRQAQLECRPALEIVAAHASPAVCLYVDPPYPVAVVPRRLYAHTMTDADHAALLEALDAHPGPVLLSGYRCALYDGRLAHWRRLERAAIAEGGRRRTEALWLNPVAVAALGRERQADLPGWSGAAAGG